MEVVKESLKIKILGFWPWPGASAVYVSKKTDKNLRIIIAKAQAVEIKNAAGSQPGTLDENLNIICGQGALKVEQIKPEGSRLMDFKDFVNGWQCCPGDLFMKIDSGAL